MREQKNDRENQYNQKMVLRKINKIDKHLASYIDQKKKKKKGKKRERNQITNI